MRKYYRLGHNPLNFGARHGDSMKWTSEERKLEEPSLSEFHSQDAAAHALTVANYGNGTSIRATKAYTV